VRRTPASFVALGATLALGLAACGSGGGSNPGVDGSSAPVGSSAVCALADPPVSGLAAPARVDGGLAHGTVGVVIDESTAVVDSPQIVAAALAGALTHAGMTPDVQVTTADPGALLAGAREVIGAGARFLILDTLDARAGARVERVADRAGVTVIDYDHLVLGGTARYLVAFDEEGAGRLQAQSLIDCLTAQGVTRPRIIMLDGGLGIDDNAVLLAKGVHEVLDPRVGAGTASVEEAAVSGWTLADAAPAFQQALTASGGEVDGVVAADDDLADAVIGVLKSRGLDGRVLIVGRGSGTRGKQNVLAGRQSLTVFEDGALEADAAARLVAALIHDQDPSTAGVTLRAFTDPASAGHRLQALWLPAQVITQADVSGGAD
jgi:D-xylose transport system substrate-binding protein